MSCRRSRGILPAFVGNTLQLIARCTPRVSWSMPRRAQRVPGIPRRRRNDGAVTRGCVAGGRSSCRAVFALIFRRRHLCGTGSRNSAPAVALEDVARTPLADGTARVQTDSHGRGAGCRRTLSKPSGLSVLAALRGTGWLRRAAAEFPSGIARCCGAIRMAFAAMRLRETSQPPACAIGTSAADR